MRLEILKPIYFLSFSYFQPFVPNFKVLKRRVTFYSTFIAQSCEFFAEVKGKLTCLESVKDSDLLTTIMTHFKPKKSDLRKCIRDIR